MTNAREAAFAALRAGLSVVPPAEDGTKHPYGAWKRYQTERPTEAQLQAWYANGRTGLGIVCGAVSGGLEMLEFEGRAVEEGLHTAFLIDRCDRAGLGEVINRITTGYSEWTPSGGIHLLYRCPEVQGNLKLARRPATAEELAADPTDGMKVLIETRGEGGYTIVAPSHGRVHPAGGVWELQAGGFDTIAIITPDERRALLEVARSFDQIPDAERPPQARFTNPGGLPGDSPLDRFDRNHTCEDILIRNGFPHHHNDRAGAHYTRPGKDPRKGSSATVWNDDGTCTLFSSSINAPAEFIGGDRNLRPSQLAGALEYGGDFTTMAADLVRAERQARATSAGPERTDSEWEAPAPLGRGGQQLPTFPAEVLPPWLREFVEALAEAMQVPVDLPGVLVLAVLATAAGGRAVVEVRDGWREPTNLFTAAAMDPGERKTPTFNRCTAPLVAAEKAATEATAPEIAEADARRKVAQAQAKDSQDRADRATDDKRDQAIRDAAAMRLMAEAVTVPTMPRLLADDATPEALTSLLAEQGGRMAVLSDEGDVFNMMAGRYTKSPNLAVYLKGHCGSRLRVDRKGRPPEYIEAPALTLGLAVQPEVLRQLDDLPGARGLGLLGRFLWSVPTSKMGRRKVGAPAVPTEIADRYDAEVVLLVQSLAEWIDPAVLPLTPDAHAALLAFETDLEPRLGPTGDLAHVRDWASKLVGHTARIAGLLHLARNVRTGWGNAIEADTVVAAIGVAGYFVGHALAVFDLIGADPQLAKARKLLAWIKGRDGEPFTRRDIHQAHRADCPKADDIDPLLELLEDHGYIRQQPQPSAGPRGGRRPSPTYDINPLIP